MSHHPRKSDIGLSPPPARLVEPGDPVAVGFAAEVRRPIAPVVGFPVVLGSRLKYAVRRCQVREDGSKGRRPENTCHAGGESPGGRTGDQ